jgi:hypothetical protein
MSHKPTKLQFIGRSVRFLEQHLDLAGPSKECKATVKDRGKPEAAGKAEAEEAPAKTAPAKTVPAKKPAAKKARAQ